jgi:hypothetical protein
VRWARRGIWENLFREFAGNGQSAGTQMIDSTHVKAHRSAAGGSKARAVVKSTAEGAAAFAFGLERLQRRDHTRNQDAANHASDY